MSDKEVVYDFVDNSLRILSELGFMKTPHPNMPVEMIDETRTTNNDWIPWKAIESKVTDNDIKEIENRIGLKFPELYVEFLKYKHFYSLDETKEKFPSTDTVCEIGRKNYMKCILNLGNQKK